MIATRWAWDEIRTRRLGGSNMNYAAVLLAAAFDADRALNSPTGYYGTTAATVAALTGLAESTCAQALRSHVTGGRLTVSGKGAARRYRITETAFA